MTRMLLLPLTIALALGTGTTRAADVELLGQPCRAKQVLGALIVTDRDDGRQRLVLLNDNETYGCELLYIDFEKDAGQAFSAPAGAGSWTGIEIPGDRLVVGTFYDGKFMIFDLKARKFIKVIEFPGESYIWNLARGSDGRVYGGTYPGAKLGAIDPNTFAFQDLGAPALPNQYLRHVSHAPWGQVFANFGMNENTTKVYDIPSKSWRDIPGLPKGQTFGVGVTWNGCFIVHDPRTGRVEAFKDASLKPADKLPFPVPANGGFAVDTALTDEKTIYLAQGSTLHRYRVGDPEFKLTKIADLDLRGGRYVAAAGDGSILGVRGQSYFRVQPGDATLQLRPIPVESKGRPPLFLEADAAGRIWGGPHFGQTLFHYDTKTGQTVNTDVVCDGGGEVYDVAFASGCVFTASYAGGDICRYDPAQPWDQWNRKNPKPLAAVQSAGFIRPTAGIRTGPDGRLYAGWSSRYGAYGGAISMTHPATGATEIIANPLGTQGLESFDLDDQRIYIGTNLGASGLPNQKTKPKFGVLDLQTHETLFEQSFNAGGVSRVTREPRTDQVLFTVDGKLHLYDPSSNTVTESPIAKLDAITAQSILAIGDGRLITACGKQIVRIDLKKRTYAVVIEAPAPVGAITLAADNRIYFSHEADLYRTTKPIR